MCSDALRSVCGADDFARLKIHCPQPLPAGKFVEIDFDAGGRVTGASISTYLLER